MSARGEILAKVRAALDGAERSLVEVPTGYRAARSAADLVQLFCERVADYEALVVRCGEEEVEARIADALAAVRSVVVPDRLSWPVEAGLPDAT